MLRTMLVLVVAGSCLAAGAAHAQVNELEPNDTCATAQGTILGDMNADFAHMYQDQDYFKIIVNSGVGYFFSTHPRNGSNAADGTYLEVLNDNCTTTYGYEASSGYSTLCLVFASDQWVKIRVWSVTADDTGDYILRVGVATGLPEVALCTLSYHAQETVSMFSRPDGLGTPFQDAFSSSGLTVDATVTPRLVDAYNNPVPCFPAEDVYLVSQTGNVILAAGMNIADGPTDGNGETTFSGALYAGGCEPTAGLTVYIGGDPLPQVIPYKFNSSDISADGAVDLTDVVMFAGDLFSGSYVYRSDLVYDGTVNLSDVVLMAQSLGAAFP